MHSFIKFTAHGDKIDALGGKLGSDYDRLSMAECPY